MRKKRKTNKVPSGNTQLCSSDKLESVVPSRDDESFGDSGNFLQVSSGIDDSDKSPTVDNGDNVIVKGNTETVMNNQRYPSVSRVQSFPINDKSLNIDKVANGAGEIDIDRKFSPCELRKKKSQTIAMYPETPPVLKPAFEEFPISSIVSSKNDADNDLIKENYKEEILFLEAPKLTSKSCFPISTVENETEFCDDGRSVNTSWVDNNSTDAHAKQQEECKKSQQLDSCDANEQPRKTTNSKKNRKRKHKKSTKERARSDFQQGSRGNKSVINDDDDSNTSGDNQLLRKKERQVVKTSDRDLRNERKEASSNPIAGEKNCPPEYKQLPVLSNRKGDSSKSSTSNCDSCVASIASDSSANVAYVNDPAKITDNRVTSNDDDGTKIAVSVGNNRFKMNSAINSNKYTFNVDDGEISTDGVKNDVEHLVKSDKYERTTTNSDLTTARTSKDNGIDRTNTAKRIMEDGHPEFNTIVGDTNNASSCINTKTPIKGCATDANIDPVTNNGSSTRNNQLKIASTGSIRVRTKAELKWYYTLERRNNTATTNTKDNNDDINIRNVTVNNSSYKASNNSSRISTGANNDYSISSLMSKNDPVTTSNQLKRNDDGSSMSTVVKSADEIRFEMNNIINNNKYTLNLDDESTNENFVVNNEYLVNKNISTRNKKTLPRKISSIDPCQIVTRVPTKAELKCYYSSEQVNSPEHTTDECTNRIADEINIGNVNENVNNSSINNASNNIRFAANNDYSISSIMCKNDPVTTDNKITSNDYSNRKTALENVERNRFKMNNIINNNKYALNLDDKSTNENFVVTNNISTTRNKKSLPRKISSIDPCQIVSRVPTKAEHKCYYSSEQVNSPEHTTDECTNRTADEINIGNVNENINNSSINNSSNSWISTGANNDYSISSLMSKNDPVTTSTQLMSNDDGSTSTVVKSAEEIRFEMNNIINNNKYTLNLDDKSTNENFVVNNEYLVNNNISTRNKSLPRKISSIDPCQIVTRVPTKAELKCYYSLEQVNSPEHTTDECTNRIADEINIGYVNENVNNSSINNASNSWISTATNNDHSISGAMCKNDPVTTCNQLMSNGDGSTSTVVKSAEEIRFEMNNIINNNKYTLNLDDKSTNENFVVNNEYFVNKNISTRNKKSLPRKISSIDPCQIVTRVPTKAELKCYYGSEQANSPEHTTDECSNRIADEINIGNVNENVNNSSINNASNSWIRFAANNDYSISSAMCKNDPVTTDNRITSNDYSNRKTALENVERNRFEMNNIINNNNYTLNLDDESTNENFVVNNEYLVNNKISTRNKKTLPRKISSINPCRIVTRVPTKAELKCYYSSEQVNSPEHTTDECTNRIADEINIGNVNENVNNSSINNASNSWISTATNNDYSISSLMSKNDPVTTSNQLMSNDNGSTSTVVKSAEEIRFEMNNIINNNKYTLNLDDKSTNENFVVNNEYVVNNNISTRNKKLLPRKISSIDRCQIVTRVPTKAELKCYYSSEQVNSPEHTTDECTNRTADEINIGNVNENVNNSSVNNASNSWISSATNNDYSISSLMSKNDPVTTSTQLMSNDDGSTSTVVKSAEELRFEMNNIINKNKYTLNLDDKSTNENFIVNNEYLVNNNISTRNKKTLPRKISSIDPCQIVTRVKTKAELKCYYSSEQNDECTNPIADEINIGNVNENVNNSSINNASNSWISTATNNDYSISSAMCKNDPVTTDNRITSNDCSNRKTALENVERNRFEMSNIIDNNKYTLNLDDESTNENFVVNNEYLVNNNISTTRNKKSLPRKISSIDPCRIVTRVPTKAELKCYYSSEQANSPEQTTDECTNRIADEINIGNVNENVNNSSINNASNSWISTATNNDYSISSIMCKNDPVTTDNKITSNDDGNKKTALENADRNRFEIDSIINNKYNIDRKFITDNDCERLGDNSKYVENSDDQCGRVNTGLNYTSGSINSGSIDLTNSARRIVKDYNPQFPTDRAVESTRNNDCIASVRNNSSTPNTSLSREISSGVIITRVPTKAELKCYYSSVTANTETTDTSRTITSDTSNDNICDNSDDSFEDDNNCSFGRITPTNSIITIPRDLSIALLKSYNDSPSVVYTTTTAVAETNNDVISVSSNNAIMRASMDGGNSNYSINSDRSNENIILSGNNTSSSANEILTEAQFERYASCTNDYRISREFSKSDRPGREANLVNSLIYSTTQNAIFNDGYQTDGINLPLYSNDNDSSSGGGSSNDDDVWSHDRRIRYCSTSRNPEELFISDDNTSDDLPSSDNDPMEIDYDHSRFPSMTPSDLLDNSRIHFDDFVRKTAHLFDDSQLYTHTATSNDAITITNTTSNDSFYRQTTTISALDDYRTQSISSSLNGYDYNWSNREKLRNIDFDVPINDQFASIFPSNGSASLAISPWSFYKSPSFRSTSGEVDSPAFSISPSAYTGINASHNPSMADILPSEVQPYAFAGIVSSSSQQPYYHRSSLDMDENNFFHRSLLDKAERTFFPHPLTSSSPSFAGSPLLSSSSSFSSSSSSSSFSAMSYYRREQYPPSLSSLHDEVSVGQISLGLHQSDPVVSVPPTKRLLVNDQTNSEDRTNISVENLSPDETHSSSASDAHLEIEFLNEITKYVVHESYNIDDLTNSPESCAPGESSTDKKTLKTSRNISDASRKNTEFGTSSKSALPLRRIGSYTESIFQDNPIYCLSEGETILWSGYNQTNLTDKCVRYFESFLLFVYASGFLEEREKLRHPYMIYCQLLNYISIISLNFQNEVNNSANRHILEKFLILSMRCECILGNKIYKLKENHALLVSDIIKTHMERNECYKPSFTPKRTSETPRFQTPGHLIHCGDRPRYFNSEEFHDEQLRNYEHLKSSDKVAVPYEIYVRYCQEYTFTRWLITYMKKWHDANMKIVNHHEDFFNDLDKRCGFLSLHSSIKSLTYYVHHAFQKLFAMLFCSAHFEQ